METQCSKATSNDGSHRLEYRDSEEGCDYYVCLDCSETIAQFIENHGC